MNNTITLDDLKSIKDTTPSKTCDTGATRLAQDEDFFNFLEKHTDIESLLASEDPRAPRWLYRCTCALNRGRWVAAEPVIAKEKFTFARYCERVVKGRVPGHEYIFLQDARTACFYAFFVVKGAWHEGEGVISTSPESSYTYARWVLGCERFKKGEVSILKAPWQSYFYARDILKKRWVEAEETIKRDRLAWAGYRDFLSLNDNCLQPELQNKAYA